jgi:hypothetical protein
MPAAADAPAASVAVPAAAVVAASGDSSSSVTDSTDGACHGGGNGGSDATPAHHAADDAHGGDGAVHVSSAPPLSLRLRPVRFNPITAIVQDPGGHVSVGDGHGNGHDEPSPPGSAPSGTRRAGRVRHVTHWLDEHTVGALAAAVEGAPAGVAPPALPSRFPLWGGVQLPSLALPFSASVWRLRHSPSSAGGEGPGRDSPAADTPQPGGGRGTPQSAPSGSPVSISALDGSGGDSVGGVSSPGSAVDGRGGVAMASPSPVGGQRRQLLRALMPRAMRPAAPPAQPTHRAASSGALSDMGAGGASTPSSDAAAAPAHVDVRLHGHVLHLARRNSDYGIVAEPAASHTEPLAGGAAGEAGSGRVHEAGDCAGMPAPSHHAVPPHAAAAHPHPDHPHTHAHSRGRNPTRRRGSAFPGKRLLDTARRSRHMQALHLLGVGTPVETAFLLLVVLFGLVVLFMTTIQSVQAAMSSGGSGSSLAAGCPVPPDA